MLQVPDMSCFNYIKVLAGFFAHQVTSTRPMTLFNKHFKIGAVPIPPFFTINQDQNGQEIYGGMLWDFIEYIKEARNCTFTVMTPPDGLWGQCYGTNNCTGMLGMVTRLQVDFALGIGNWQKRLCVNLN